MPAARSGFAPAADPHRSRSPLDNAGAFIDPQAASLAPQQRVSPRNPPWYRLDHARKPGLAIKQRNV
jgi:hypothetical protein